MGKKVRSRPQCKCTECMCGKTKNDNLTDSKYKSFFQSDYIGHIGADFNEVYQSTLLRGEL